MIECREQFLDSSYEEPRGELEAALATIVANVLEVDRVGREDSFYDFGGTSLQAIRICARIERDLGYRIMPVWLFESDVLAEFAARVAAATPLAATSDGEKETPDNLSPYALTADAARGTAGESGADDRGHPLSFAQQRLWLLYKMSPESYSVSEAHRLEGDLDIAALRGAMADVAARHAMLRTTFREVDGVPFQVIASDIAVPFEVIAVPGGPGGDRASAARDEIARLYATPFSLEEGPLLRLTLLTLDPGQFILVLTAHHIAVDERSIEVFWRDLAAFYRSRISGEPTGLRPLPARYADYAAAQREARDRGDFAAHLDFWRSQVAGVPASLELPTDFPRSDPDVLVSEVARFSLPATTACAVADLAQGARATTFMVLLAAFGVTVSRLAGRDDLLIGIFASNRANTDLEDVIGLFVNVLPVRITCSGDPTFAELLAGVREAALAAYSHQELPFDHLVTAVRPPRDPTEHPLVQVGFQAFGSRSQRLSLPGTTSSVAGEEQTGNMLDLMMIIAEDEGGLAGELHYRADLFSPATARALADRLAQAITVLAGDPGRRLSDLG
jgi:hypothetical protein